MSQQGDIPDDPKRRDFLRKIGLGAPVAIGGILAAGGLSVSGGMNQALTDALYIKKKPTSPGLSENVIQQLFDTQRVLILKPSSLSPNGLAQQIFTAIDLGEPNNFLEIGLDAGNGPLISGVVDVSLPNSFGTSISILAGLSDIPDGISAQTAQMFAVANPTRTLFNNIFTTFGAFYLGRVQLGNGGFGGAGLDLNWSIFNQFGFGEGGVTISDGGQGGDVGLPTGTVGGAAKNLATGDHRHAFTGRFFFDGFLPDIALGGALPVIWKRSIIANAITLRRITVDAITPSTGVGNDVIRVGDGTSFLAVNLPSGGGTATATGTVNIAGGATLRIDVNGRDTIPAKNVNVTVDYTMNQ